MSELVFDIEFDKQKVISKIDNPFVYKLIDFGFDLEGNGLKTKIAILSTGVHNHNDISDFADVEVFIDNANGPNDNIGQATMYAGIIGSDKKTGLTGFVPKAKQYFAKCISNNKKSNESAISASLLWAIVKQVDVIILDVLPEKITESLQRVINKVNKHNIFLLFPNDTSWKNTILLKNEKYLTTYLGNKYTEANTNIVSMGAIASIALLIIQKQKTEKKKYTSLSISKQIKDMIMEK